jgi:predicted short-subunit dehydrogenase-like oxidoreductase (DUF2520 family)
MHPSRANTPALPPIVVVGRGRMGAAIARSAAAHGLEATLAGRDGLAEAAADAEVALICVPDAEIATAGAALAAAAPGLRFVGHTSGANGLEILAAGPTAFSLHPLQTVPDGSSELLGAPAAIEGATPEALELARNLAEALGMSPFELAPEARAAYHAAASMASNFLIALEESAAGLLADAGVENPRELLAPLVLRTAANWAESGDAALTGPIARGDEATVARHLEAIAATSPDLEPLYTVLAERTRSLASQREGAGA